MPVTYDQLMALESKDRPFAYSETDSLLYAISVGMGRDPLDREELAYVTEQSAIKTVPSQACVLARVPLLVDVGLDYTKVLHGEQFLTLHRPLPAAAELLATSRVIEAYDKGPDKGAVIYVESTVRDQASGEPLFTVRQSTFARGDGGFGGNTAPSPAPHRMPTRPADHVFASETRPDQALLYRLNGDRNPLHSDPDVAARAGFKAPILHGLCTYGVACRAILANLCAYDHTRIERFDVRFTAPVYPGERIATQIWVDGNDVSFLSRVEERGLTVLDNGYCKLRTAVG